MRRALLAAFAVAFPLCSAAAEPQPEVKAAQALLLVLGYYDGPINGEFGGDTRAAWVKYRVTNALPSDNSEPDRESLRRLLDQVLSEGAVMGSVPPVTLNSARTALEPENPQAGVYSSRAEVYLTFKNNTRKVVSGVEYTFTIRDAFGDALVSDRRRHDVDIGPGLAERENYYFYWEDNEFIKDQPFDKVFTAFHAGTAKVEVEIERVAFRDGTVISLKEADR